MSGLDAHEEFLCNGYSHARGAVRQMMCTILKDQVVELARTAGPLPDSSVAISQVGESLFLPTGLSDRSAADPMRSISRILNIHQWPVMAQIETPHILDLLRRILGPDIDCCHSEVLLGHPDGLGFPWHQDAAAPPAISGTSVVVLLALTDLHTNAGAPVVVPASHNSGTLRHTAQRGSGAGAGLVSIKLPASVRQREIAMQGGDILIVDPNLIYSVMPNRSGQRAFLLRLHYASAVENIDATPSTFERVPVCREQDSPPARRRQAG